LRQIGSLPKSLDPKAFSDYLLTLGMKTRIDERPEGWDLWIYNEDHIAQARDELDHYVSHPDDPRYRDATQTAQVIRRNEQRLDQQFRKNYRDASDLWGAPGLRQRPLTSLLVAICVVVFLLQQTSWGFRMQRQMWFASFDVRGGQLHSHGLDDIRHGEVWRLVTPIFMHVNPIHIFFNMWWLVALGTMIETRRGTARLAVLVLISAVISNVGQFLYMEEANPGKPQIFEGMSGVVYALFGYIWMKGLYEPEQGMIMLPNNVTIMIVWLFLCMTGAIGPIANAAHVLGLVVGVTFGVLRY
jgi:GlpG protein